ncbi:hypothetical protein C8K36_1011320 [Rhodococcus sp. OK519]|nr:hypothetical protein C8K36_1011320 [Rhodococcus sp. OK519]
MRVEEHDLQQIPSVRESAEQVLGTRIERDDIEDRAENNRSRLPPGVEKQATLLWHRLFHCVAIKFPRDASKGVKMSLLIACESQGARQFREDLFGGWRSRPLLHTPVVVHADVCAHRHMVAPKAGNASMPDNGKTEAHSPTESPSSPEPPAGSVLPPRSASPNSAIQSLSSPDSVTASTHSKTVSAPTAVPRMHYRPTSPTATPSLRPRIGSPTSSAQLTCSSPTQACSSSPESATSPSPTGTLKSISTSKAQ